MGSAPTGERYTQVYIKKGPPARDSARFRVRLAGYFNDNLRGLSAVVARQVQSEIGVEIRFGVDGYQVDAHLKNCELGDLLDTITLVYTLARWNDESGARGLRQSLSPGFLAFVARALAEENLGYRVDESGGIHPVVDAEFDRSRAATVAALSHRDLANALQAHEAAYKHFEAQHQDTKAAVRSGFESVEILAKLLCPKAQRLNHQLIAGNLRTVCAPVMAHDPTEVAALGAFFDSLDDWATGMHNYRHGQGSIDPVAPSTQFAVWALSAGSGYARVLAECYARLNP